MRVRGLRFRLNRLRWCLTRRKSKTLWRKAMARTRPTPRRMRRRNLQAIRAPALGSRRTVIITTTADITTVGTTAGKLRRVYHWLLPHNQFRSGHKAARHGLGVPSSMGLRVAEVIEEEGRFLPVALSDVRFRG